MRVSHYVFAQKCSKDIFKTVQVDIRGSIVIYEAMRILFKHKENKGNIRHHPRDM